MMVSRPLINSDRSLPGFEHIKKYFDANRKLNVIKIMPGQYYVSNQQELITTVLGSCISACVRDSSVGIGGMNHFMIPTCDTQLTTSEKQLVTRYGLYAMEHLINDIFKYGGSRKNIEIKLFGGGNMMASSTNIGAQNISFVTEFVKTEGYKVISKDLGGSYPRKINYCPLSGKVMMKKLSQVNNDAISKQELQLQVSLENDKAVDNVDLF